MILAVADTAEGTGPPPPELVLAWQALRWHALPEAGGLRDQRAGEVAKMEAVLSTYDAVRSWHASANWAKWAARFPHHWAVVQNVITLREKLGNVSDG